MVDLAGLRVEGISIGGIETCLEVPEYKLAFDVGRCPPSAVSRPTLLFTHAHIDHLGGVAFHAATRSLRALGTPTYVVPPHAVKPLGQLFEAWRGLDGSDLPHEVVALAPGEEHALASGRVVRPFRSYHRVPCQGYVVWSVRKCLRAPYRGLPQAEIARLARAGEDVSERLEVPEIAFTGDTCIEVIEREESVRESATPDPGSDLPR